MDGIGKPFGGAVQLKAGGDNVFIIGVISGIKLQLQHTLILAAQERQDAVRRQLVERFVEVKVVLELCSLGLFSFDDVRAHGSLGEHSLTHLTYKIGVEGEAIHQNGARAVEGLLGVLKTFGNKGLRQLFWGGFGIRDELIGQLLKAGLASNIGLGLAALLIRQVQVLQTRLGLAGKDLFLEGVGKLALLLNRSKDGLFALLQFLQVVCALFKGT